MTMETSPTRQLLAMGMILLAVLSGLCTIFALVTTAAQAWQEHAQEGWPKVSAQVEKIGMQRTSTRRRQSFNIRCRLSYAIGTEQHLATIYSATVPSSEVSQYPPNQIAPFEQWVDQHPPGTPILVRYDPANHTKVMPVSDYMPRGGPHTPNNLKLLELFGGSFVVLLLIARIIRPRTPDNPNVFQSS
jgi:Protein of unknown function (DUF3592)